MLCVYFLYRFYYTGSISKQQAHCCLLKAIGNDEDLPQLDDENQNVA